MFTKEDIKNAIDKYPIIDLSSDDPEDIYVAKWQIENEIKESNPFYTKTTLAKFISNLHLGNIIFVYDGSSLPFTVFHNRMFVASGIEEGINKLKSFLSSIGYDLSKLSKFDPIELMNGKEYGPEYMLIDNNVMIRTEENS